MSKLLTTVASAALLFGATGVYANDYHGADHSGDAMHNAGQYSAIQKGQSASTKAYGYNKQGDHYSTSNAHRDSWNNSYNQTYPGAASAYGAKQSVMIKKGGNGIADSSSEANSRQYGTYWN